VNLPAFLLSKNLVPDSLGGLDLRRGALLAEDRAIFSNNCRQKRPIKYKTRRRAPGIAAMCLAASREAQLVLSRANKAPHYRICSLDYFRPDCESPARPGTFRMHRAICYLTKRQKYVKAFAKHFSLAFHTPVEAVGNHAPPAISSVPSRKFLAFFFRRPGLQPRRKARRMNWALAPEDSELLQYFRDTTLGDPERFRKASGREKGMAPCISGNCLNVRGHEAV
jgi:hypothetical protein